MPSSPLSSSPRVKTTDNDTSADINQQPAALQPSGTDDALSSVEVSKEESQQPSAVTPEGKPTKASTKSLSGNNVWRTVTVVLLRIVVGAVFIVSGFAKSVDPWGTVYKMGEYFEVWHWHVPLTLIASAAFTLAIVEFLFGIMLLLGCYRRSVVCGLLLMMAVMLPLTVYIYVADPVADCGCFGDLWHISNFATMAKNFILTAALVYLFIYNKTVRSVVSAPVQWIAGVFSVLYPLILALIGYNDQPLLDFRSFPVGTSLVATANDNELSMAEGEEYVESADNDDEQEYAETSVPEFEFLYEKDNERRTFTVDNLPDSTWTYVDRKLISGNAGVKDDFTIFDENGNDVTADVIADNGEMYILTIPSLLRADVSQTYYINQFYDWLSRHDIPLLAVISGSERQTELWKDLSMAEYPIYTADPAQIKELARGRMGLVHLKDGVIDRKWSAAPLFDELYAEDNIDESMLTEPEGETKALNSLTVIYLILMAAIICLNNGVLAILSLWRSKLRKSESVKN